jgi:site-specific DNA-cytosine methylase
MRVLVACEFSGIVRNAFTAKGHDAWSCDILPTESPGNHIQDDILNHLDKDWDLMIAHPPCTHLAVSGARWFTEGKKDWSLQIEALDFVRKLLNAPIKKIALENPISVISTKIRKPNQIIQPFQFGHDVSKKTCLWLKNLPNLIPTKIVKPDIIERKNGYRMSRHNWETLKLPSKIRGKIRSRFFEGIAEAMADQWG